MLIYTQRTAQECGSAMKNGEGLGGPLRGHSWCPHRGSREGLGGLTEAIDGVLTEDGEGEGLGGEGLGVLQEAIVVSSQRIEKGWGASQRP